MGLTGNRAALARGSRQIDEDFNRAWSQERVLGLRDRPASADASSEEREQRELLAALDAQLAERRGPVVCLDLHTTSAAGTPFVVISDTLLNRRFRLRPPRSGGSRPGRAAGEHHPGTIWGKRGTSPWVLEGGQNDSPSAVAIHMAAIRTVLATAGCIRAEDLPLPGDGLEARGAETEDVPRVVEVRYHHVIREGDDFVMEPGVRELPAGRTRTNPGPGPPGTDPRQRDGTHPHAALSGTGDGRVLSGETGPAVLAADGQVAAAPAHRPPSAGVAGGTTIPGTSRRLWWSTRASPVGSCSNSSTCWAFAGGNPGKAS